MSTYSKQFLSGSTYGRMIKVAATSTPGTTIHTSHASDKDEVWLWAVNSSTADVKLTVEFGGTTSPDDTIEYTVKAEDGLYLIIPGWVSSNSQVIKAFAGTTNVIMVGGYVNRIT